MIDTISAIIAIFSLVVSFIAYNFSRASFKQGLHSQNYSNLDITYLDLYKTAMNYPFVLDESLVSEYKNSLHGEKRLIYEAYAQQVWVICETIYDSFVPNGKIENPQNWETWKTAITVESKLHISWLLDYDQKRKFKPLFFDFMKNMYIQDYISIRNMEISDFNEIEIIQNNVYNSDILEDIEILKKKFQSFPQGCFVALYEEKAIGYLITYPIHTNKIPLLNEVYELTEKPNALFIHDLAISSRFQKLGIASLLLVQFENLVKQNRYSEIHLVSVQKSLNFWLSKGFEIYTPSSIASLNYGANANVMKKSTKRR